MQRAINLTSYDLMLYNLLCDFDLFLTESAIKKIVSPLFLHIAYIYTHRTFSQLFFLRYALDGALKIYKKIILSWLKFSVGEKREQIFFRDIWHETF